ncbi:Tetraketide alpha-pyrone reductase 1 [Apostasia shenzhenica]|uniref:Tetraketide alpha-pyrone reductase 1 n=1 Tax=Apostasia shenzhenica TaxID=1088818 RepID=A0A2I0ABY1_9ASPA|nr:Tetraketide alpha-pyrone reductase 1 [Apostasia shenzhenica]
MPLPPLTYLCFNIRSILSDYHFSISLALSLTMAPAIERRTEETVCVLDASSTLGSALVERLLHRGYTVHAATCARGDAADAPWMENKRVRVFRSDPLDYQSIAAAFRGCSGVFYTFEGDSSYDELMVEVEVMAAHNVLEACAQNDTVEKVVFTSSMTAVIWKENRKMTENVDERDWSEPNFCRKFKLWHALAKMLSEKTAWALAMDRGVQMVVVNAGLLLAGLELSPSSPYLKGAPEMYNDGVLVTVELKFLVDAHICIFENPATYGRYLCFNWAVCCPEDAVKLSQMLSPSAPHPPSSDGLAVIQQKIQSKKLSKLLLEFGDGLAE